MVIGNENCSFPLDFFSGREILKGMDAVIAV